MEPAATMAILPWELSKASAKTPPMKVRRNGRAHNQGAAGNSGGDEEQENQGTEERGGVAEVAGATHAEVEQRRGRSGDGNAGVGKCREKTAGGIEGEPEEARSGAEEVTERIGRETVTGEDEDERAAEARRTTGRTWLLRPSATQSMSARPNSAAMGSAAMWDAAAMPKMAVSRIMRGRHLRAGPCMAWATPMQV